MAATITLPGIGGSDEAHWQTLWEKNDGDIARIRPSGWDKPDLDDWIEAVDRLVRSSREPPLLVAHSLACLLVAHWAAKRNLPVRGAFLVAVPDPDGPAFPRQAQSFRNPPSRALPFPALVIASTNDPFGPLDYARACADQWQAGLVIVGALGHINSSKGLGYWQQGADLLAAFRAGTRRA